VGLEKKNNKLERVNTRLERQEKVKKGGKRDVLSEDERWLEMEIG
jgi:hypothetical protein